MAAAVIRREGRYLVGRRPEGKRHAGLWEFPGGKVGEGEAVSDALARELREELALVALSVGDALFEMQDPGSPFLIRFIGVEVGGEPRAIEHQALGWFTLTELEAMPLAPSDARFVETLSSPPPASSAPARP